MTRYSSSLTRISLGHDMIAPASKLRKVELRKDEFMNRAEFEADFQREGYQIREGEIKPNEHRAAHTHDFDARLFVLDGSITIVFGDDRRTYGPGAEW